MGDRLQRYGFTLNKTGATLTPQLMRDYVKEQIGFAYAFSAAPVTNAFTTTSTSIPFGSNVKKNAITPEAIKYEQELSKRGLKPLMSASTAMTGEASRPLTGVDGNAFYAKNAGTAGDSATWFSREFFGRVFGSGKPLESPRDIPKLFRSEADAYKVIDYVFDNDPEISNRAFKATQDMADWQKIKGDSGFNLNPVKGLLMVAGAAAGFTGLTSAIAGKLGMNFSVKLPGVGSLPIAGGTSAATTIATQGLTKIAGNMIQKAMTPSSPPPVVDKTPGVNAVGKDLGAAIEANQNAPTQRKTFLPPFLSARSAQRVDSLRMRQGKSNFRNASMIRGRSGK